MERSAFPQQGMSVAAEVLDRQFGMTLREAFYLQLLAAMVANAALTTNAKDLEAAPARALALSADAVLLLEEDPITTARRDELASLGPRRIP